MAAFLASSLRQPSAVRGLPVLTQCVQALSMPGEASRTPVAAHPADMHRQFSSSRAAADQSSSMGLWEALGLVASPSNLAASGLEWVHNATGLPWWASIPLTGIAVRAALLPLSVKARQASFNLQLMHTAIQQAKVLTAGLPADEVHSLGRVQLVKGLYQHLQAQHQLPSLRWYWGNGAVQGAVLLTATSALNSMCAAVWPGLTKEGPPGLQDLTSPPVILATLSTPFGTLGSLVPLAILLFYLRGVDLSPAAQVPGIGIAMRVLAAPLYALSLIQPHATLLYWLTQACTYCVIHQTAVQSVPGSGTQGALLAAAAAPGAVVSSYSVDAPALSALGKYYSSQKDSPATVTAAAVCYGLAVKAVQADLGRRASQAVPPGGAASVGQAAATQEAAAAAARARGQGEGQRILDVGAGLPAEPGPTTGGQGTVAAAAGSAGVRQAGAAAGKGEGEGEKSEERGSDEERELVDGVEVGVDEELQQQVELLEEAQAGLAAAQARKAKWTTA